VDQTCRAVVEVTGFSLSICGVLMNISFSVMMAVICDVRFHKISLY